jgi:hypothetical protein
VLGTLYRIDFVSWIRSQNNGGKGRVGYFKKIKNVLMAFAIGFSAQ